MNVLDFTCSDSVAGYVESYEGPTRALVLSLSDGRSAEMTLADNLSSSIVRNLGEPYRDSTADTEGMLVPGRYVFAHGIHYPDSGFEVKQLVFPQDAGQDFVFEQPSWWVKQIELIGDFYLRGQFPDGDYDWRNYRTTLSLAGTHTPDYVEPDFRQETDTISRLVYALSTAYLLTGKDDFLEAAENGTAYLREHMRVSDEEEGIVYWYHGMDVTTGGQRKIFASEFGDDVDAIPAYEQIYALVGPTQTFRITGDPAILHDIDATIALFRKYFKDEKLGGYFSHVDPVTMSPRAATLGPNRARKNWNSVGDHAPAYLINAVLATGREDLADFLVETGDTIIDRFPDLDHSPFVQERFHEDWSADRSWGWQQDRAVVGHNLKIAWNLMRINSLRPDERYVEVARRIAATMPAVGSDQRRGGWYDVVERTLAPGQRHHRFVWHDRKAWWQQEQAILAYLILGGILDDEEHRRLAREASSFYNANFLDHDDGGVYFNVLANGVPYLVGQERLKGSHPMAGYHKAELAYLAAVYTGLLNRGHAVELHFRPHAEADRLLRVAPDLLPPGRVRLTDVWMDGVPYLDFDPEALTVALPASDTRLRVRVRIAPTDLAFDGWVAQSATGARVVCRGSLDDGQVGRLHALLVEALALNSSVLEVDLTEVTALSRGALNQLLLLEAKLTSADHRLGAIRVLGAQPSIADRLRSTDAFELVEVDQLTGGRA